LCAPVLPAAPTGYTDRDTPLPPSFFAATAGTVAFSDRTPPGSATTNWGATLGRVLFYDVRLSASDRVACASCHLQSLGFGDTLPRSPGLDGRLPRRRTLALANARFNAAGRYRWDETAPSLEAQVLMPIADTLEMGLPLGDLEAKLARVAYYPGLFTAAFGSPLITRKRIAAALAQFVRSMVSSRAAFDSMFVTGGAPDPGRLVPQVLEGSRLFNAVGCHNCHRTIAYFADRPANIGLDSLPSDSGAGEGRFKPASLRNVAVRPPYMHDGRFAALRDVVAFYDHGVVASPGLDRRLRSTDGAPRRLHLTERQQESLVAFLVALTDSSFLRAERFSDPFPCSPARRRS
jgi:cytochrome c peroxidase